MTLDLEPIEGVLARHRRDPNYLVQILREVQECYGYLPPEAITHIAKQVGHSRAIVEGVATFYSFFYTKPVGRYRVLFSDSITDQMLGSRKLFDQMCQRLWVEPGKMSEDGLVSVDTTSCTGMCDQGPAVLVNGITVTRLSTQRVDEMCDLISAKVPLSQWPADYFEVEDNIRRRDILLKTAFQPGEAIGASIARGPVLMAEAASNERSWRESAVAVAWGRVETLDEIKASNLRGRGGGGFTIGLKWEACRAAPGMARYVICNADEGEPGTFKDRVLLTNCADLVFEGMTICGYVIGAQKGFLYLRGEYRYLLDRLNEVLARRRRQRLLGRTIAGQIGFDFDIEIHLGAGAYVCGEESALIESLEGRRGMPRSRPPYPVTNGYLNQPTVLNNVETFAASALVALNGGEWYRRHGTPKSAGTKILSVSGDCAYPGIFEYPFGVSVRQVLKDCGAVDPQAVQISGPSGVCIDESEFDRCIAFEDLPTAGAFMIFNRSRDMFEVARNFTHFFAHESCGFCTPCRVGTTLLKNFVDKIHQGHGSQFDLNEMSDLIQVMKTASHCGLGHTAPNSLLYTMQKFRPAYERRLTSTEFQPAFDLDGALAPARQMTGRDDPAAHLEAEA